MHHVFLKNTRCNTDDILLTMKEEGIDRQHLLQERKHLVYEDMIDYTGRSGKLHASKGGFIWLGMQ
jgi:hypothetical protein